MDTSLSTTELKKPPKEAGTWLSARYCLAYLSFFGFVNVYALRANMSVAILSMVNTTYQQQHSNTSVATSSCPHNAQPDQKTVDGEFDWDEKQQGLVLGSFFYGYIFTQIPGGYLAGKFGSKYLFGLGVLCTSVLTLLTPLAARTSYDLLIALRVVEGLGEGVTFPAMHAMWGRWAPPIERSFLISVTYAGTHFGTVISQSVSGVLCSSDFLGGWPSVFYVFGGLGVLWCLLWFKFAHSSPQDHPRISEEELEFINRNVPPTCKEGSTPWKEILTSGPVWALSIAYMTNNWGFYTLLTCLPKFLKDILQFDVAKSGFVASLPYLVMWFMVNIVAVLADFVRGNGYLNTTQTRKAFSSIGLFGCGFFLVLVPFVGCDPVLAVALLCLACGVNAFGAGGFSPNHVDLSCRYSGILMGLSNSFGTISGFLAPLVVGALIENNNTREQWQLIFMIASVVYSVGAVFYLLLASGETQPFNDNYKQLVSIERSHSSSA